MPLVEHGRLSPRHLIEPHPDATGQSSGQSDNTAVNSGSADLAVEKATPRAPEFYGTTKLALYDVLGQNLQIDPSVVGRINFQLKQQVEAGARLINNSKDIKEFAKFHKAELTPPDFDTAITILDRLPIDPEVSEEQKTIIKATLERRKAERESVKSTTVLFPYIETTVVNSKKRKDESKDVTVARLLRNACLGIAVIDVAIMATGVQPPLFNYANSVDAGTMLLLGVIQQVYINLRNRGGGRKKR